VTDAATTRTAPAKTRVPLWDNARFACVTLVVIGHGIQRLTGESDHALIVYLFLYAFHMPAFAMISGFFSKASPPSSRQMKKILTDIVLPYAIMETIWTAVQFLTEGSTSPNPTTPHWTLWFLLALGIFRLILPYLVLLRYPLIWAVVFSVGVGYFSNVDNTFSLARAIGILPFFVLGWQMRQWKLIEKWRVVDKQAWWIRGAAVALFAAWIAALIVFLGFWKSIDVHWFFYDDSYDGLGQVTWWSGLARVGVILLAVLLSAAFFVLVPRRQTWMTGLGQATMYIYLLHSFILYPIRETGILKNISESDGWLIAMILVCIGISIALGSPFIRRVFRFVIEPRPKWLFIPIDDEQPGPSRRDPTGSRREKGR
jgi:fucose 4-O-acetylase-like acetyltransferase